MFHISLFGDKIRVKEIQSCEVFAEAAYHG